MDRTVHYDRLAILNMHKQFAQASQHKYTYKQENSENLCPLPFKNPQKKNDEVNSLIA